MLLVASSGTRVMYRHITLTSGSMALTALLWVSAIGTAQKKPSTSEQDLMDAVNRERKAGELSTLKWDEGLARAARKHAELMAEQKLLLHQLPDESELSVRAHDAGARFSHITENIGMAEFASAFHEGWMHSPGHRANILDPKIDSIGIAVVEGEESLFAVEDFALAVENLSLEEQEKRVGLLLAARGLHLLNIGDAEKKNCEAKANKQLVGSHRPGYVSRYETTNISQMPEDVKKELSLPRYKSAAVEACPEKEVSGFTSFRMIIVLYSVE